MAPVAQVVAMFPPRVARAAGVCRLLARAPAARVVVTFRRLVLVWVVGMCRRPAGVVVVGVVGVCGARVVVTFRRLVLVWVVGMCRRPAGVVAGTAAERQAASVGTVAVVSVHTVAVVSVGTVAVVSVGTMAVVATAGALVVATEAVVWVAATAGAAGTDSSLLPPDFPCAGCLAPLRSWGPAAGSSAGRASAGRSVMAGPVGRSSADHSGAAVVVVAMASVVSVTASNP